MRRLLVEFLDRSQLHIGQSFYRRRYQRYPSGRRLRRRNRCRLLDVEDPRSRRLAPQEVRLSLVLPLMVLLCR